MSRFLELLKPHNAILTLSQDKIIYLEQEILKLYGGQ